MKFSTEYRQEYEAGLAAMNVPNHSGGSNLITDLPQRSHTLVNPNINLKPTFLFPASTFDVQSLSSSELSLPPESHAHI